MNEAPEMNEASAQFFENLLFCGLKESEITIGAPDLNYPERSTVSAAIGPVVFTSDWAYTRVSIKTGIPLALANKIQNTPYPGSLGRYSGGDQILGSVVRVDGFCGGAEPAERATEMLDGKCVCLTVRDDGKPYKESVLKFVRQDPDCVILTPEEYEAAKGRIEKRVQSYHIDSLLGLKMFIDIIRAELN